jgi:hypothetical protein
MVGSANNARKDAMKHGHSAPYSRFSVPYTKFSVNSAPMIVGAVLFGAGSLIGLSGVIVGGTAMMSAGRRWLRELQVQPSEVAKNEMGQAKAATIAGPSTWQQHSDVQRTRA